MAREQATGKLTLLRVHDTKTFGPPQDRIEVQAVINLNTAAPGEQFGFTLRNDANRVAHQGMLDLLRDAFTHNFTVRIDFEIDPGKKHGVIERVDIRKS